MNPRSQRSVRRVHSAEFKAKVLAQCGAPGASVSAVALANGVNANLVRKWLEGRGLKRCGLAGDEAAVRQAGRHAQRAPALQFVPVGLAPAGLSAESGTQCGTATSAETAHIHVQLCRGSASLGVRWPASQAGLCTAWLRELAGKVLK